MFVGYWHKGGLEIYRTAEGKVAKFASGGVDTLKPVKSFGKIVLIVGRELLLHTRKKFPPASADDLKKAVSLEIGEMFPIKNPSFFLTVFERTESYTLADIWAWDSSGYDNLKRVFPFTHVLPEDMAFISGEPEISAVSGTDVSWLLAHSKKGFLGVSTFRGGVSRSHIEMLLKTISRHVEEFKRVNLYGAEAVADMHGFGLPVVKKDSRGYPACFGNLSSLDLKQFSVRTGPAFLEYVDVGMRSVIYLLVAYGLSLIVAGMHYDAASNEVKMKTAKLGSGMSAITPLAKGGVRGVQYEEAAGELKEKVKGWRSPLPVMDLLAKNLPDKSYVTRMLLNETTLELTVISNNPLGVVKALGKAEGVKTVKLKGSPIKNSPFYLTVELK